MFTLSLALWPVALEAAHCGSFHKDHKTRSDNNPYRSDASSRLTCIAAKSTHHRLNMPHVPVEMATLIRVPLNCTSVSALSSAILQNSKVLVPGHCLGTHQGTPHVFNPPEQEQHMRVIWCQATPAGQSASRNPMRGSMLLCWCDLDWIVGAAGMESWKKRGNCRSGGRTAWGGRKLKSRCRLGGDPLFQIPHPWVGALLAGCQKSPLPRPYACLLKGVLSNSTQIAQFSSVLDKKMQKKKSGGQTFLSLF